MLRSTAIRVALAMASAVWGFPVSGQDLPPAGRSLFDHLTIDAHGIQRVPFPFAALVDRVRREIGADPLGHAGVRSVLIPLGRSLQRNASVAEAYRYPRIVAAVLGEPLPGAALLRDRLYLGYHEKAAVLEVISYNEAAGRFEFQVVKDYRKAGTARVFYSRRVICTACHHDGAPIFSRPGWDETNANPRVAAELKRVRDTFHGVPAAGNLDEPNAIDNAVARANRLGLIQQIWREGCAPDEAIDCRAEALVAALKYRLGGELAVDASSEEYRLRLRSPLRKAQARWPQGLPVTDPGIPNRDPLAPFPVGRAGFGDAAALLLSAEVRPAFDPLQPRSPISRWQAGNHADVAGYVRGVAEFFAAADIRAIDRGLQKLRTNSARRAIRATCRAERASGSATLRCTSDPAMEQSLQAEIRLVGSEGKTAAARAFGVSVSGATAARPIHLTPAAPHKAHRASIAWTYTGPPLRISDARVIERVSLRWPVAERSDAELELRLADDTPALARAIDTMARQTRAGRGDALAEAPIRRAVLMRGLSAQLGVAVPRVCCDLPLRAQPPQLDFDPPQSRDPLPAEIQVFVRHCAACHDSREDAPPGFLHGSAETVRRNLTRCAERIAHRLAMWEQTPESRPRMPMPPPLANGVAVPPPPREDLARMRAYLARLGGPNGDRDGPYEARPTCRADTD